MISNKQGETMGAAGLKRRFARHVGLAVVLCSGSAGATLGQVPAFDAPAATAPPVTQAASPLATFWLAPSGLYAVLEVSLETGTLVREYSNAEGLVFAVSWRGPVLPDLSALLGTYFSVFQQGADEARQAGQRGAPVRVAQDGLVVHSSGRTPHFFGYAYVTHLVPLGISVKDVVQ